MYLYSVENVITLGKLIGLLFCLPSSLFFLLKTPKIQGMSSPCNGNHYSSIFSFFRILTLMQICVQVIFFTETWYRYWASETSPTLGCSIEISRDWASEGSPTLGCSIEISGDNDVGMSVHGS